MFASPLCVSSPHALLPPLSPPALRRLLRLTPFLPANYILYAVASSADRNRGILESRTGDAAERAPLSGREICPLLAAYARLDRGWMEGCQKGPFRQ